MTAEVVIIDSGLVCAAGNQETCWQKMLTGQTALSPLALPDLDYHVGKINTLPDELGSKARLSALIKLGLDQLQSNVDLSNTALLVATTKGAADAPLTDFKQAQQGFAWQVAEMIAQEIGLQGSHATVSAACASGIRSSWT